MSVNANPSSRRILSIGPNSSNKTTATHALPPAVRKGLEGIASIGRVLPTPPRNPSPLPSVLEIAGSSRAHIAELEARREASRTPSPTLMPPAMERRENVLRNTHDEFERDSTPIAIAAPQARRIIPTRGLHSSEERLQAFLAIDKDDDDMVRTSISELSTSQARFEAFNAIDDDDMVRTSTPELSASQARFEAFNATDNDDDMVRIS